MDPPGTSALRAYARLRPARDGLVRSTVFPVPDPDLPFLGVHLTRHAGGLLIARPTADAAERPWAAA